MKTKDVLYLCWCIIIILCTVGCVETPRQKELRLSDEYYWRKCGPYVKYTTFHAGDANYAIFDKCNGGVEVINIGNEKDIVFFIYDEENK